MLQSIKRFYDRNIGAPSLGVTSREATDHALRLATAALLIEITGADSHVKDEEMATVSIALERKFSLSKEETAELILLAREEAASSVSFYEFTSLINKGFSYERKRRVVELLWEVVFSDSEMEKHEEHYVRKIAGLLHVSHEDFIAAKLKAGGG